MRRLRAVGSGMASVMLGFGLRLLLVVVDPRTLFDWNVTHVTTAVLEVLQIREQIQT